MKMIIKYFFILVLASFVFAGCCTTHKKAATWEYKIVKLHALKFEDQQVELDEISKDGWKLLTIDQGDETYIFERPKH